MGTSSRRQNKKNLTHLLCTLLLINAISTFINTPTAQANPCTKAPDAPIIKVDYPNATSGPIFTITAATTGDAPTALVESHDYFRMGTAIWEPWSEFRKTDLATGKETLIWDSGNNPAFRNIAIVAYSYNNCGASAQSRPDPDSLGVPMLFKQQKLGFDATFNWDEDQGKRAEQSHPYFHDIKIASSAGLDMKIEIATPEICTASPISLPASHFAATTPVFLIHATAEGLCTLRATNAGKVGFSALDETFSTYIRPMEQWVTVQYQKNYAGLGVNTKAFLFTQQAEGCFEFSCINPIKVEGTKDTKDTVKSTTPTICSVSRTESPRDFTIKGLKVGQCVIQYSNAGVAEYPPINKLITIKVEKLSAITPANGKILRSHDCARNNYKERIQEMVLTPRLTCPKTYSDWP
ncbi:MAG: hypothetical protein NTY21_05610 [Actinobacteria bacterium]|nr:hypothetical protein [Actinomycetota bacterium]